MNIANCILTIQGMATMATVVVVSSINHINKPNNRSLRNLNITFIILRLGMETEIKGQPNKNVAYLHIILTESSLYLGCPVQSLL